MGASAVEVAAAAGAGGEAESIVAALSFFSFFFGGSGVRSIFGVWTRSKLTRV